MILIISNNNDSQTDRVEQILRKNGSHYSRLNVDPESLQLMQVTFKENAFKIDGPSCSFSTEEIDVIWNRTFRNDQLDESGFPHHKEYLALKETWDKAFELLFSLPESIKWLNFFYDFYSETQLGRYSFSKSIGFKWPYYICSNDINYLNEFFEHKKERILVLMNQPCRVKAINDCFVESRSRLSTVSSGNRSNEVECLTDSSAYKVRCTVVGKEYFAAKIKPNSSASGKGIVESYNYYPIVYPPKSIKTRTIQIMNELNLTHGIFDFIVDENQEWFFDALNPMGNYQWVEDMRSPDISASIAKWLMENNLMKNN